MSMGGLLLAFSAVNAISQIGQGYVQKAEADYNATVAEGKARLIGVQQDIEKSRYARLRGQYMGTGLANIAASGIGASGSPMAVLMDTQKQIFIDEAIGQLNLEVEKQYTKAEAGAYRRKGNYAVYSGYGNAFSSLLRGVSNYAMYKGFNLNQGADRAGKG